MSLSTSVLRRLNKVDESKLLPLEEFVLKTAKINKKFHNAIMECNQESLDSLLESYISNDKNMYDNSRVVASKVLRMKLTGDFN